VRPDQVWGVDITYLHLKAEFVYSAVIMDVYTRSLRGWYLSRNLDPDVTSTALKRALTHRTPESHPSDQGVQYATTAYTDLLQAARVPLSMAETGEATQNGYAERLIRTIKEEEVDLSDYLDFADAYHQMGRFLEDVYMRKRIHSSLGYLTPVEFENQWSAPNSPLARLLTKKRCCCVQFLGRSSTFLAARGLPVCGAPRRRAARRSQVRNVTGADLHERYFKGKKARRKVNAGYAVAIGIV
jgi:hypothetical protein